MRPEIACLDTRVMAWTSLGTNGIRRKLLSVDTRTGEETAYVEIPKGWRGVGNGHHHSVYEEALIISGDVSLNGVDSLVAGSYLYRPGGIVHGSDEQSRDGCLCLIRMGGKTDLNYIDGPKRPDEFVLDPVEDGRPHIVHLVTERMPWTWHGTGAARWGRKVLSEDVITGARSEILSFPRRWTGAATLPLGRDAELFVVHGTACLADGTQLNAGCYTSAPASRTTPVSIAVAEAALVAVWIGPVAA
jgi:hypothetical protein